jgi:hypothetical protein
MKMSRFVLSCLVGSLFLVVGCGDTSSGGTSCADGEIECDGQCVTGFSTPPTLAELQTNVFTGSCALSTACHTGTNPAESLDLSSLDASNANLLGDGSGAPSEQSDTLSRVEPGDSSASYLMNKLNGVGLEEDSAGNPSGRMPLDGVLCSSKLEAVRAWIDSL